MQNAVAIIPARYDSTRFPGKPLAPLNGKIMIQHVYERVSKAALVNEVLVATDDKRIFDAVTAFGGKAVMTLDSHESGSDRIAEAVEGIDCDVVVNVQGDEPFIEPLMIDSVIELLYNDEKASMSTLAKKITDIGELRSPNVVKVVMDCEGYALYFSRSPVPYIRDSWQDLENIVLKDGMPPVFKHVGIYGFRKKELMAFSSMPRTSLESIEKLEQLRALETGMKIKVGVTEFETIGIDTPEDMKKAESIYK